MLSIEIGIIVGLSAPVLLLLARGHHLLWYYEVFTAG